MTTGSIQYPALLHYRNDDELEVVSSGEDWDHKSQSRTFVGGVQPGDRLIDSQGRVYSLQLSCGEVQLQQGDVRLSVAQVLQLVRRHASLQGSCCVAKIGARSINEAIHLVTQLTD